jgi:putative ubiquitin-RnfH superfamily antitoxin RatB of RatAB toxin-antitoxin module
MPTPIQNSRLRVEVVCCMANNVFRKEMLVPQGQTLGWAVNASGIYSLYPHLKGMVLGLAGTCFPPETLLLDGDRAEVYLPLSEGAVRNAQQIRARGAGNRG